MLSVPVDVSVSRRATHSAAERVVVAVKAERVISKAALAWALTHVVRPGDCVTLLAVFPGEKTGNSSKFSFLSLRIKGLFSCHLWEFFLFSGRMRESDLQLI